MNWCHLLIFYYFKFHITFFFFLYLFLYFVLFIRSEEHTSELQSRLHLVCRLLLEKKKHNTNIHLPHCLDPCAVDPHPFVQTVALRLTACPSTHTSHSYSTPPIHLSYHSNIHSPRY